MNSKKDQRQEYSFYRFYLRLFSEGGCQNGEY